jgi:hypothetical protein
VGFGVARRGEPGGSVRPGVGRGTSQRGEGGRSQALLYALRVGRCLLRRLSLFLFWLLRQWHPSTLENPI